MTMDVWSSPMARVAATTVFALANEQPLLRPASSTAARIAAALPIDTEQVPKAAVEELIAGISEGEARRLAGLADRLAPPAWHALVSAVGGVLASLLHPESVWSKRKRARRKPWSALLGPSARWRPFLVRANRACSVADGAGAAGRGSPRSPAAARRARLERRITS